MAQGLVVFGVINLFTGIDALFLARRNLDLGAPSGSAQDTAQVLDDRGLRSSKTDPNYVICPHCGMEQWKGCKECQKCRTHFG